MKTVALFCGSSMPHNKEIVEAAAALARRIAKEGHTLVYGGSNLGLMGVVSSAAMNEGGRVVAVIPTLFPEDVIQSQQVSEIIRVRSMAERKERIIAMCDAFVALPGGIGTLDELFEVAVANQLRRFSGNADKPAKPMIMFDVDGFYSSLLSQLDLMRKEGLLHGDCGLLSATTLDEIIKLLR
jgi:uncharacterized protein (TIGR00730 family)